MSWLEFKIFLSNLVAIYNNLLNDPGYKAVRAVFIIFDILFIVAIIVILKLAFAFRPDFSSKKKKSASSPLLNVGENRKSWKKIIEKSASNPPQSLTLAIIEADKFVDDILKRVGLQGETMADRMKLLSYDLKTLDKLWQAHKLRNELAHTHDFKVSESGAKTALQNYEEFLKEMKVI